MPTARPLGLLFLAVITLSSCTRDPPSRSGRVTLDVGGVTWRILSGRWTKDGDVLLGSGGHIQSVADLTDGTIELDVDEQGALGRKIGIGFRYMLVDDDPARSSGYTLNLSAHAFNVFRGANNYWLPLNPDTKGLIPSSIVDPKKNHVTIRMKGSSFEIEVNGSVLVSVSDEAYAHGHVNLWVESSDQSVVFSNIHVTS